MYHRGDKYALLSDLCAWGRAQILTSVALLVFDYLLTFREEFQLFWRRKWTGATVLFFLNRYLTLIEHILNMIGSSPVPDKVSYM